MNLEPAIAIIGGSGLYEIDGAKKIDGAAFSAEIHSSVGS